uniref:FUN14 family protein n=1 Tax=Peronospora matthiolae TaxID=2874970 RepID=A0AAV1TVF0_9STRA
MLRLARTRHRALFLWQQGRYINDTSCIAQCKCYSKTVKPRSTFAGNSNSRFYGISGLCPTWHQATHDHTKSNYSAATLAAGACGVLGCMEEQHPATCAATKGSSDEDPFEKSKKKMQEISTLAIVQLVALFPDDDGNVKKKVDAFLASGKGGQISWGFFTGACAGFALKKASKLGVAAIGALFVLLQCACYSGYVNVDVKKLKRDFEQYVGINQDGGLDTKDVDYMYKSVMEALETRLPAGSGFAVGFVLGFRSG